MAFSNNVSITYKLALVKAQNKHLRTYEVNTARNIGYRLRSWNALGPKLTKTQSIFCPQGLHFIQNFSVSLKRLI